MKKIMLILLSVVIVSVGLHFCQQKDGMETEIGFVIPSTTSQVGGNFKNPGVVDKIEKRDGTRFVLRKLNDDAIGVINEHIPVNYTSADFPNGYGYKEGLVISSPEQAYYHLSEYFSMAVMVGRGVCSYAEDDDFYYLSAPGAGRHAYYFSIGKRVTKKGGSVRTWRVKDAPPEPQIDLNDDYSNLPDIGSNPFLISEDEREQ